MPTKNLQLKIPKLRLPDFFGEWEERKLKDIVIFLRGKGIPKEDISEQGINKCIRYGELYTEYKEIIKDVKSRTNIPTEESTLSKKNDMMIPSSGETALDIARVSCVREDGVLLGGGLSIMRPKDGFSGEFFSYYLSNFKKKSMAIFAQGNSVVHLYESHIKNIKINSPSFQEQKKIFEFLWSTDELINNLKEQRENLEAYKKGIVQKIFTQEIRLKDKNGKEFSKWEEKKLSQVFYSEKGDGLPKSAIVEDGKNECILYGELYTTYKEVVFNVNSKTNSNDGLESQIGDLLIPCSTTTTGIDLANVTALNKKGVLLGGDITVLRSKEKINNIFYAYYLSNYKKRDMAKYAQGSTIVHLYYNHFKKMTIDLPNYEEQQKIAEFLTSIDKLIESKQQQIIQAEQWKKGLMQGLFI